MWPRSALPSFFFATHRHTTALKWHETAKKNSIGNRTRTSWLEDWYSNHYANETRQLMFLTTYNNNFIYVYKYARERRGLDQQINRRVRSKSQYEFPPLFLKNTSVESFRIRGCFGRSWACVQVVVLKILCVTFVFTNKDPNDRNLFSIAIVYCNWKKITC